MRAANYSDTKWLIRQIRSHFPDWTVEGIRSQSVQRTVFKVRCSGQTAEIHAVCFSRDDASLANPPQPWHTRAKGYTAWVNKLCGLKNERSLALPSQYVQGSSVLHGGVKLVLVLQEELLPLSDQLRQTGNLTEIATLFLTVCQAVQTCRRERLPHGELTCRNLMCRPDGSYCLGGMLDVQRLDDFNQYMPSEASELLQAALLIRELMEKNVQENENSEAVVSLDQLLHRAAVGEKGLSLQKVIAELERIIPLLPLTGKHAVSRPAGTSGLRDMTDMFSTEDGDDTIGLRGKHAACDEDLDRTVGVRRESAPIQSAETSEPDPDMTIGLRTPAVAQPVLVPKDRMVSSTEASADPLDSDQTISML